MSPEAQHEAIASECGYYLIHDEETDSCALRNGDVNYRGPWHRHGHEQFAWEDAPDYLSDLNAMHEAEKGLQSAFHYIQILGEVVTRVYGDNRDAIRLSITATAGQRAEAFLRTLGKWRDDK